jgi:hypothetical protein
MRQLQLQRYWPVARRTVAAAPGEDWRRIDRALLKGHRGLAVGSTLVSLLIEQRGAQGLSKRPRLTVEQIVAWADAHHRRTRRWPNQDSGPVAGVEGETWGAVTAALRLGLRGLHGLDSLADFLDRHRRARLPI